MPSRNAKLGDIYTRAQAQAAAADAAPGFEQAAVEAAAELIARKSEFKGTKGATVKAFDGTTRRSGSKSRTVARNRIADQEAAAAMKLEV